MGFYDDMQGIATGLLRDFKQGTIRYIKLTKGQGPAQNPGPPSEAATTIPGATASSTFSVNAANAKFSPNSLIQSGDIMVVAEAPALAAVALALTDFIEIDGIRYRIIVIGKTPAAGVTVAYTFFVRR